MIQINPLIHTKNITKKYALSNTISPSNKDMVFDTKRSLSFKGINDKTDFLYKQIKLSEEKLNNAIWEILNKDNIILNNSFWGEVNDETKFTKAGWYLKLKENNPSEVTNIIKKMGFRNFIALYDNYYNSELQSSYAVARGQYEYLDIAKNEEIKKEFKNYKNLDNYLEKKLDEYFLTNPQIQNTTEEFIKKHKKLFPLKITSSTENPLYINPQQLSFFMDIIDKILNESDKKNVELLYKNINYLSESLKENNKDILVNSFTNLKKIVLDYYYTDIMTIKKSMEQEQVKNIKNFVESEDYNFLNHTGKMDLIFKFDDFDLDSKNFIVEKFIYDKSENLSTTLTLLDFLNNMVPSSNQKKQIIQNIITKDEIAHQNFEALKEAFILDIREQNYNSSILEKSLNGISILEHIEEMLPNKNEYILSYLNKLTNEDLNKLLDKLKHLWINQKYQEACQEEEQKYDLNSNFNKIESFLNIKINNQEITIGEFLIDSFQKLFGDNKEIKESNIKSLKTALENQQKINALDKKANTHYKAMMEQMALIVKILASQNKETTILHAEISKILDKLEQIYPDQQKDIIYTKSTLEKIKDGILNERNLMPAGMAILMGTKAFAEGAAGALLDPTGLTMLFMTILYGSNIIKNIRKEFKK